MIRSRRVFFLSAALALSIAGLVPGTASANLVFTLDDSNLGSPPHSGGQNFGTITLDGTSSQVTISIVMASGYGFKDFGFNYSGLGQIATVSGVGDSAGGPTTFKSGAGSGFDGFGQFLDEQDAESYGGAANASTSALFTITGTGLDLTEFENVSTGSYPAYFAVHLIPLDGSSTFFAGARLAPTGTVPELPPTSTVPEPSSLFGAVTATLFGLGYRWRRGKSRTL
jgi:hypothetical protein